MSRCLASIHDERAPAKAGEKKPVLLIVDDEENVLHSIRRLFHADGYTILTARDGFTALDMLDHHAVDVAICDMRMPGMDGVELISIMRRRHPSTVCIMLTGYVGVDAMAEAVNEGGVYKFFSKPWDDAVLRSAVKEALSHLGKERCSRIHGGDRCS